MRDRLRRTRIVTANWNAISDNVWTVPVGGGMGRVFRLGFQPVNVSATFYGNVVHPADGSPWGMRLQIAFLFPKRPEPEEKLRLKSTTILCDPSMVVYLSFLTVARCIAKFHDVYLATRSRVARSNEEWNKMSLVVPPAGLSPWRKTRAYKYSAGACVAGCINGMMWIGRNETHHDQSRRRQLDALSCDTEVK
jgi:hypothetical protein